MYDNIWQNIHKACVLITRHFNSRLRKHDLTANQYIMLKTINQSQRMLTDLSYELGIDRTTTNRNLIPLTERGLIFRMRHVVDKRSTVYQLTDSGVELLDRAEKEWLLANAEIIDFIEANNIEGVESQVARLHEIP